jgi:hypothetical protein
MGSSCSKTSTADDTTPYEIRCFVHNDTTTFKLKLHIGQEVGDLKDLAAEKGIGIQGMDGHLAKDLVVWKVCHHICP